MKNTFMYMRMMVIMSLSASFFSAVGQTSDKKAIKAIQQHRKEQKATFKNPEESPLSEEDRKTFKDLDYYPIDLAYHVQARFIKNETPVLFQMKTSKPITKGFVK